MFSIDPRSAEYPWQTAYAYHRNSPVWVIDYMGGGDGGTVFFLQYEGRASLAITTSTAIGIMVDTHGNIGIYNSTTGGLGFIVGASTGWSAGFLTSDYISETSGWGSTVGALITTSAGVGVAAGAEINFAFKESGDVDFGMTIPLPIQIGAVGTQVGIYSEATYTSVYEVGNIKNGMADLFSALEKELGVSLSEEQRGQYTGFFTQNYSSYLKSQITTLEEEFTSTLDKWEIGEMSTAEMESITIDLSSQISGYNEQLSNNE